VATALDKELGDLAVAVQAQSPRESAGAALATDLARLPAVLGLS
jgi:hypothetical protein